MAYNNREIILVKIDNIIFGQDNIGKRFKDRRDLQDLCQDLLSGEVTLADFAPISVSSDGPRGQWHAIDGNRRLYVLKKLHAKGRLESSTIQVKPTKPFREMTPTTMDKLVVRGRSNMGAIIDRIIDEAEDGIVFKDQKSRQLHERKRQRKEQVWARVQKTYQFSDSWLKEFKFLYILCMFCKELL